MSSERKPSAPVAGVNPTTVVEPIFQQLVATGMAAALQYLKTEAKLISMLGPIDADVTRYALVGSLSLVMGFYAAMVNKARVNYNVPWPFLMLNKGDKNAIEYNAVQRAHANHAEAAIFLVPVILVIAPLAPATILVNSLLWCWGKFLMNYTYATATDTGKRFMIGGWSYLPYFALQGYVWLGLAAKLGLTTLV